MKFKKPVINIEDNFLEETLKYYGVKNIEEFIQPTEKNLASYTDLDNINDGVELLKSVMILPEPKIALIVDCDTDGYTSSAIIYQYIKNHINPNTKIDYYIHEEKVHGLEDVQDIILPKLYDLVIIPDAGSNDIKYVKELIKSNSKVLILDHHIVEEQLGNTDTFVLINNQISPNYRNKDLSGAGIVYQFCRALDAAYGHNHADDYIDLAALGICADMMSALDVENQYLWKTGFKNMKNHFFVALAQKQAYSITKKMGATDEDIIEALNPTSVAFYIVPFINAMVRVGTMEEKRRMFEAFIDGDRLIPSQKRGAKGTLEKIAVESTRECANAKRHQDDAKEEIAKNLEKRILEQGLLDNKILFVKLTDADKFLQPLTGLVCMQLSAKYNRPTILARYNKEEDTYSGSARGLDKSEVSSFKEFLNNTELFNYTIGHDNAFGCSINNDLIDEFFNRSNEILKDVNFGEKIYEPMFVRYPNDSDLEKIIYDLSNKEVFWGQKCQLPLILVENIFLEKKDIQIMGKNKDTIKFTKNGISYLKFFAKDLIAQLDNFDGKICATVIGEAGINEWMGRTNPQISIKDIELKEAKFEF